MKALLVGETGEVVGRSRVPYTRSRRAAHIDGVWEQRPQVYLRALERAVIASGAARSNVQGIGIVGQTPTLVFLDDRGRAIRPAITWGDTRAAAEASELSAQLGEPTALLGTDLPWSASNPPAKLLWLARHEPGTVSATRWVLNPKDYLGLLLTDSPVSDPWSTKGMCDLRTNAPAAAVLAACGWDARVVPRLDDPWGARGSVTRAAASRFKVPHGIPVAVGWTDALGAMLAVGAFDAPTAFVLTGTSDIVGASTERDMVSAPGLLTIPQSCAPLAVVYGPTQSGGASIDWLARLLRLPTERLELLAQDATGPDRLTFVPFIAGERAPYWRTDLRGAFVGLAASDGPAELARAVMSGVALAGRDILQIAEAALGSDLTEIGIGGWRGTRSSWLSVHLQILGRPLAVCEEPDVSTLGATILAFAATGRTLGEARAHMVPRVRRLEPSSGDSASGARAFRAYRQAVAAVMEEATA